MRNYYIFLLLIVLLSGCGEHQQEITQNMIGDWVQIEKQKKEDYPPPSFISTGMTISKDSLDRYTGFFTDYTDGNGKFRLRYFGNKAAWKLDKDRMLFKNPSTQKWEFAWRFVGRSGDTLKVGFDDSTVVCYKKLSYKVDKLNDFDKIIFSGPGCYGTCPILNISIDYEGNVLFQGEEFTDKKSFYKGKLDQQTTRFIFEKFRKANPLKLDSVYSQIVTDQEEVTVSFVKNGKLVKTIYDYAHSGPNELEWAIIPLANLFQIVSLGQVKTDKSLLPVGHHFALSKGDLFYRLQKSESFYLWSQLATAAETETDFKARYDLLIISSFDYLVPPINIKKSKLNKEFLVSTDGRFYRFNLKDRSVTYDLGYDFIEKNISFIDPNKAKK